MNISEKFPEGSVCKHKATGLKCVVIEVKVNQVKVRTEKDLLIEYFPQELIGEAEIKAAKEQQDREIAELNEQKRREMENRYGL